MSAITGETVFKKCHDTSPDMRTTREWAQVKKPGDDDVHTTSLSAQIALNDNGKHVSDLRIQCRQALSSSNRKRLSGSWC